MSMTPLEIALKQIEDCRRTRWKSLDLRWRCVGITEIPEQVFELTWLESLDISGWATSTGNIQIIPPAIQRLTKLTKFICDRNQISDLSALSGLSCLQELNCSDNQVSNLSALIGLSCLQKLNCSDNRISDLSALTGLSSLRELDCGNNQISDLSALSGLTSLQRLHCASNQISDLSALSSLLSLQHLSCWSNQISDLSALSGLLSLQKLNCGSNQISDLSPVKSLLSLQKLDCENNQISELQPLNGLLSLQYLKCGHNQVTDLTLTNLPALKTLDCSNNHIREMRLSGLLSLQKLNCSNTQMIDLNTLSKLTMVNQISDLSSLSSLTALQRLDCDHNQIRDLSPLRSLFHLEWLSCEGNQISDLSPLSALHALEYLSCGSNQIIDLSALREMSFLQTLSCSMNQIIDLSPLRSLFVLQYLHCRHNQISNLSPISGLRSLQTLDCDHNHIKDVSILYSFVMSGQLQRLNLSSNPVVGVPSNLTETKGSEFIYAGCLNNFRNYWQDLSKGSAKHQQLKIQLVGNGRVGKMTLAYALEHRQAPSEDFKSTHGIVIKELQQAWAGEEEPVTLQVWDFGGQEIYHATHRLFLSDDCLYLLVWAEATEEQADETCHPVSYWLEAIHDLAPHSAVILVKNQIDRSDRLPARPAELTADLPGVKQIRQDVKISAMQYRGLPALRGAIESVLEELKPRICLELPISWLQVQEELKHLDEKVIPFAQFQQLCIKAGVSDPRWFANYLHKTGVLFYRAGAFQDQLILDQNWVIQAAYRVFDPQKQRSLIEDDLKGCFKGRHTHFI